MIETTDKKHMYGLRRLCYNKNVNMLHSFAMPGTLARGRTGFDRGSCGMVSEPGSHQPEIRWNKLTANEEYALAA